MPIHCFLKTSQDLEVSKIELDLQEIIHRKFHNVFKIQVYFEKNELCDWEIRYDNVHYFPIRLKTNKELEFEHPCDTWSYWAQTVIEDELAIKYNAKIRDEDYPQQELKPEPEKHLTFRQFLETTIHHSPQWKKAIIDIEISQLPEELKKF